MESVNKASAQVVGEFGEEGENHVGDLGIVVTRQGVQAGGAEVVVGGNADDFEQGVDRFGTIDLAEGGDQTGRGASDRRSRRGWFSKPRRSHRPCLGGCRSPATRRRNATALRPIPAARRASCGPKPPLQNPGLAAWHRRFRERARAAQAERQIALFQVAGEAAHQAFDDHLTDDRALPNRSIMKERQHLIDIVRDARLDSPPDRQRQERIMNVFVMREQVLQNRQGLRGGSLRVQAI